MSSPDTQPELRSKTIIPPVQGWNTKDALSAMGPEYAVEAENFFSNGSSVDYRRGYRYYAKNVGTSTVVLSLGELALQNGTRKLLGIPSDGRTYSINPGGTQTDLSNAGAILINGDSAQYVNYRNKIWIKDDGATAAYYWDGVSANLTPATWSGGPGSGLSSPMPYKGRLYYLGSDLSVWYSDLNAISGNQTQFDFQSQCTLGGKGFFCGPTSQIGNNNDQFFAYITNQGEVLIYAGDYPGNVASWALVGHYYMPPPVSKLSFFYWGQNLVIITYQGVVLLSDVMRAEGDLVFLSDKINDQFVDTIANVAFCTGIYFPKGNMLVFNLYQGGALFVQFVMNTITRSWWKWTDVYSYCWSLYNNDLYFGTSGINAGITNGKVFQMWTGYFDENPNSEGNAQARTIKLRPAYNYMGDTESFKQFTFCIPTVYQNNGLDLTIDSDVDYANRTATSQNVDTSKGNTYQIYQPRCGLQGIGKAASIRIDGTVTDKQSSLQAIEVFYVEADVA